MGLALNDLQTSTKLTQGFPWINPVSPGSGGL